MADEKSGHEDGKPTIVGGEAASGAAKPSHVGEDNKPAGVGPVDKAPEIEQQPT